MAPALQSSAVKHVSGDATAHGLPCSTHRKRDQHFALHCSVLSTADCTMAATQKGVLLGPATFVKEVDVPQPSSDPKPEDYADLLPHDAKAGAAVLGISPFSRLTGAPVVVVFRMPPVPPGNNPLATRLLASLDYGFGPDVLGSAVAFYAAPGQDFTSDTWGELDNVIYGPFLDLWGSGEEVTKEKLQEMADDYKAGRYRQENPSSTDDSDDE